MEWLAVGVGAGLGAPLRYVIARGVQSRYESVMPWGTLVVNSIGSFLLGACYLLVGETGVMLTTGLCGALSTYSTFSYETIQLMRTHGYRYACANVVVTVVVGLGTYWLGHKLIGYLACP